MAEINNNNNERSAADAQQKEDVMREQMLKVLLTTEARERLANIRMVKPDIARLIENQIIQLANILLSKRFGGVQKKGLVWSL